jgi:hypothetical protein
VFSLESADGIYVITRGFINEKRTLENGFTPQVCCNKFQCLWWLVLQDVPHLMMFILRVSLELMDFSFLYFMVRF